MALLAIVVAWLARGRALAALAALACALTVAVQLPAEHWFYNYLVWIAPFALVAQLAREPLRRDPPRSGRRSPSARTPVGPLSRRKADDLGPASNVRAVRAREHDRGS